MYDIIIIGAGPAGLTASIYGRRSNKKVLVLEANTYGGQIINTLGIENYPVESHITGFDFATNLYNQAKDLGSIIKFEKVNEIKNYDDYKEVVTNKETYKTKTIIIATGAKNRKLGIEREDELIGRGISYCASCDGAFFKGKDVAVIGGGNTAVEDAMYLSNVANKVYVIIRSNKFNTQDKNVYDLKNKSNVEIIYNNSIKSLNGEKFIESIDIVDKENTITNIKVSGVFIAVGRIPANDFLKDLIELDSSGYIVSDETCHTNIEGIYVAGDNRVKALRQLVTATSDGAIAASEAIKYVNSK